jgi:hypothetical protein
MKLVQIWIGQKLLLSGGLVEPEKKVEKGVGLAHKRVCYYSPGAQKDFSYIFKGYYSVRGMS